MRVLVVTNLFPNPYQPHRGAWNRHQIAALAQRHEVSVIAPIMWTDEIICRTRQGRKLEPHRCSNFTGLKVAHPTYYYPPKLLRAQYGRCFQLSIQRAFRQCVQTFRPDIVFATWAYPDGWAAVNLSRSAGLPVVVKVHGSDIHQLDRYAGRVSGTLGALAAADAIVAVSRDLAGQITQLGIDEAKIHVVYNGIDVDVFQPGCRHTARKRLGLKEDETILLTIGNLVPVKGIDDLLQACRHLADGGSRFRCHVLGEGPLLAKLRRKATQLEITDRVTFHGAKPQKELPDWYRAANLVVLPSHAEGIPNVLLEAAACGTPFVATDVGGISELSIDQGSCLVRPKSPRELANAIGQCLAAPLCTSQSNISRRTHDTVGHELACLFEKFVPKNLRREVALAT